MFRNNIMLVLKYLFKRTHRLYDVLSLVPNLLNWDEYTFVTQSEEAIIVPFCNSDKYIAMLFPVIVIPTVKWVVSLTKVSIQYGKTFGLYKFFYFDPNNYSLIVDFQVMA